MWQWVWWIIERLVSAVTHLFHTTLHTLLFVCLFISLCHILGWTERLIWYMIERQGSIVLNGTQLTIGSFELHWTSILQGKITIHISNAIIHTPQRDLWRWDSPVIARIGSIKVDCNAPITILNELLTGKQVPLEIYSAQVSDIQVFAERKQNIFNVYLLDPSILLPDPKDLIQHEHQQEQQEQNNSSDSKPKLKNRTSFQRGVSDLVADDDEAEDQLRMLLSDDDSESSNKQQQLLLQQQQSDETDSNVSTQHKEKAHQLVNEMLHAFQSLGRAAQKGSLQGALQEQGQQLAVKLRGIQQMDEKRKDTLKQGARVMKEVGKVAVETLKAPPLEKLVPKRIADFQPPPPVYGRVGRIIIKDLRIFTRTSWIKLEQQQKQEQQQLNADGSNSNINNNNSVSSITSNKNNNKNLFKSIKSGWNKPITIQTVVIRAPELCPPMSLKEDDELPAIYQPLEKIGDVVWKRVVAEMAKTNGGRLFQTAMKEVLGFMKIPDA